MNRDPSYHSTIIEAARLALLKAGPYSGLHGEAAASMDRQLAEARDYLGEIAERRKARLAAEGAR